MAANLEELKGLLDQGIQEVIRARVQVRTAETDAGHAQKVTDGIGLQRIAEDTGTSKNEAKIAAEALDIAGKRLSKGIGDVARAAASQNKPLAQVAVSEDTIQLKPIIGYVDEAATKLDKAARELTVTYGGGPLAEAVSAAHAKLDEVSDQISALGGSRQGIQEKVEATG